MSDSFIEAEAATIHRTLLLIVAVLLVAEFAAHRVFGQPNSADILDYNGVDYTILAKFSIQQNEQYYGLLAVAKNANVKEYGYSILIMNRVENRVEFKTPSSKDEQIDFKKITVLRLNHSDQFDIVYGNSGEEPSDSNSVCVISYNQRFHHNCLKDIYLFLLRKFEGDIYPSIVTKQYVDEIFWHYPDAPEPQFFIEKIYAFMNNQFMEADYGKYKKDILRRIESIDRIIAKTEHDKFDEKDPDMKEILALMRPHYLSALKRVRNATCSQIRVRCGGD